jgi:hypothetical protein
MKKPSQAMPAELEGEEDHPRHIVVHTTQATTEAGALGVLGEHQCTSHTHPNLTMKKSMEIFKIDG